MFVRVLFLLLLAANLGAASWLVFAPSTQANQAPVSDPGVPKLVLLSERDHGDDATAELAAAPESRADLRNDECHSIGTFPTQADVRAAINVLTPLTRRIQFREAHATQARGYWVYLPALQTREQALGCCATAFFQRRARLLRRHRRRSAEHDFTWPVPRPGQRRAASCRNRSARIHAADRSRAPRSCPSTGSTTRRDRSASARLAQQARCRRRSAARAGNRVFLSVRRHWTPI